MYDNTLHAASVGGAKGLMTTLMQTNSTEVINKTSTIYETNKWRIQEVSFGTAKLSCMPQSDTMHVKHYWFKSC